MGEPDNHTAVKDRYGQVYARADDRLSEDYYDRQYIAEHLTEAIGALLAGRTEPARPF